MFSFTDFLILIEVGCLLTLLHGLLQFLAVTAGLVGLLSHLIFAVSRIGLGLALNDGSPFIDSPVTIRRIVPLIVVGEGVELTTLVFEWLLNALRVDFQRINQVVRHLGEERILFNYWLKLKSETT